MTDKDIYGFGSYDVTEISHYTITLSDGIKLSSKLWIPDFRRDSTKCFSDKFLDFNLNTFDVHLIGKNDHSDKSLEADEKFPVILEYLPYHKDIQTAARDHNRHPWFASHGFVVMRVEMRGTGASEGFYFGEYLPQEQTDCSQVLQFIASQRWSSGRVGMYGKSWGGFNGLQMAYDEPESSPLKTAISLYSTDNRYLDDMHYEGGTPIGVGLLAWSATMLKLIALPPPPRCFSEKEKWLDAWTERLKKTKSSMSSWTHHQLPGPFWDHGSICVNYDKIKIPILAIGGLEDGYKTAAERMARKLDNKSKVLIGPWTHDWPDVSTTGPNIEYLDMCLNWFTFHLKNENIDVGNKCSDWPRLQIYIRDSYKPNDLLEPSEGEASPSGRFVAFKDWIEIGNSVEDAMTSYTNVGECNVPNMINTLYFEKDFLNENKISFKPHTSNLKKKTVKLFSHALQGLNCGAWLNVGGEFESPGDQSTSIANSVSFVSDPLVEPLVMVGLSTCILKLKSSCWRRVYMSVKVSDLHPDGTATLVTRCQYDLNSLQPLTSDGDTKTFALTMKLISHCFQPHNKIVISIAPNAFPMMWPSFVAADIQILSGDCKFIYQTELLETLSNNTVNFPKPRPLLPIPKVKLGSPKYSYSVTNIADKFNFVYQEESGLEHLLHTVNVKQQSKCIATYVVDETVNTALATIDQERIVVFDSLRFVDAPECTEIGVKISTHQVLSGDANHYGLEEELSVTWIDSEETIFNKTWSDVIPRLDHNTWL